jgi:hypothetical protein
MQILLRLIHVLAGVFWVGSFWFVTFYLFPVLGAAGPAAAPVMGGLRRRGLMTVLPIMALLTILSGIVLFWRLGGGSLGAYAASPSGGTYAGAGAVAIVAFLIGFLVARPAAMASGQLMQELAGLAPGPEREVLATRLAALQRRSVLVNRLVAGLLAVATAGMALARYL